MLAGNIDRAELATVSGSISNIDGAEYHCNKTAVRKVISGVVGAASSVTSIQVANLLRLFRIPQVSTRENQYASPPSHDMRYLDDPAEQNIPQENFIPISLLLAKKNLFRIKIPTRVCPSPFAL